jgi:hypothetical protein
VTDDVNLPKSSLNEEEKNLAMSVSKRMSIVDQVLLILLCDETKKKKKDVTNLLFLLERIGLDEGELHTLYRKCCQENFDQVRIVLYGWARGQITTEELKKKIHAKEDLHTMCKTIFF